MCGRFTLTTPPQALEELFEIRCTDNLAPRYNIAPTQQASIIGLTRNGQRELRNFNWGLVPQWAKDTSQAAKAINARSETLAEKPTFREAFARRRCLVPTDGFYEWATLADGRKQPYFLALGDRRCFAFAGLWEGWRSAAGEIHRSFTIITTTAITELEDLHHRMPVILSPDNYAAWLDPAASMGGLQAMLRPYRLQPVTRLAVGPTVNNARRDDASCLQAAGAEAVASQPASLFDQTIRQAS
jgi:putative SOS response-associated peptidase YedK